MSYFISENKLSFFWHAYQTKHDMIIAHTLTDIFLLGVTIEIDSLSVYIVYAPPPIAMSNNFKMTNKTVWCFRKHFIHGHWLIVRNTRIILLCIS